MRVHVARFKNRKGEYSFKYNRIPQAQGDYKIHELNEANKIDFSFSVSITDEQINKVINRWEHKIVSITVNKNGRLID